MNHPIPQGALAPEVKASSSIPQAVPTESFPMADPMVHLERVRQAQKRWKSVAIGAIVAFAAVGLVSVVQFAGTFITCQMLYEAQKETGRARQDCLQLAEENHRIYEEVKRLGNVAADAKTATVEILRKWKMDDLYDAMISEREEEKIRARLSEIMEREMKKLEDLQEARKLEEERIVDVLTQQQREQKNLRGLRALADESRRQNETLQPREPLGEPQRSAPR